MTDLGPPSLVCTHGVVCEHRDEKLQAGEEREGGITPASVTKEGSENQPTNQPAAPFFLTDSSNHDGSRIQKAEAEPDLVPW